MDFSKLSKAQLVEILQAIQRATTDALPKASKAATQYSPDDSFSRLAFEVGYLGGIIKEIASYLNDENN